MDFCHPWRGVSRLPIRAWQIQKHRIAFATHSPDVREVRDAGLAHVAYQNLLVCTGYAGIAIDKA